MSEVELKPGWFARDVKRAADRVKEWQSGGEPKIDLLAKALAGAELNYRDAYQKFGGSDIRTGRAWDKMRKAGDAIREHFYQQEECTDTDAAKAPVADKDRP